MIVEALSLLPEVTVRSDDEHVFIRFQDRPEEIEIRLHDAVDSLLTVWRDYETLQERTSDKRNSGA